METRSRSIVKALSYRVLGIFITTSVAYLFTAELSFALKIGLLDTLIKLLAYYFHERLWMRIKFGLKSPPEYRI